MVIRNCKAKTDSQYNRQKKRDPKKNPIIIYKRLHRKLDCGIRFPQKPGVNTFLKRYILELGIMGSCYLCSFELVVWLYFVFVCCVLFVGYRLNFAFKIIFFDTCMKNNTNKNRNKAWHTLFKISMNNWYKKIFFFFFYITVICSVTETDESNDITHTCADIKVYAHCSFFLSIR